MEGWGRGLQIQLSELQIDFPIGWLVLAGALLLAAFQLPLCWAGASIQLAWSGLDTALRTRDYGDK